MRRRVRLTEGDLRRMVNMNVRRILREGDAEDYEISCLERERCDDSDEYDPYVALGNIYQDIDATVKELAERFDDDYIELSFKPILRNIDNCMMHLD